MLYEIRWLSPVQFNPSIHWTYKEARREFELAKEVMTHQPGHELWKFSIWKWKWEKLDEFARSK